MNALERGKSRACYAHARGFYERVETAQVDSGPSIFRLKTEVGATTYVKGYLICDSAFPSIHTIAVWCAFAIEGHPANGSTGAASTSRHGFGVRRYMRSDATLLDYATQNSQRRRRQ